MDLNCDLGEGEPAVRTRALMRWITSANIACRGHAGDGRSMEFCVRAAAARGVRIGAHPGTAAGFGREPTGITVAELERLLLHQVGALAVIARSARQAMAHVKLHGALYHAVESDGTLAAGYVATLGRWFPRLRVVARAGGRVAPIARRAGLAVWEEAFLDRGYRADGTLIPRGDAGALISDARVIRDRIRDVRSGRGLLTGSGGRLHITPGTWCVHADSPDAPRIARLAARELGLTPPRRRVPPA